ncbi:MAG: corrinoid protein [archaeon]|nr:corrinoid protein [archaeon]
MSNITILDNLSSSIQRFNKKDAVVYSNEALGAGIDPLIAINEGLVKGMNIVGEKFKAHKVYLPQVLVAASALYAGLDVLLPHIPQSELENSKKAVVAVVHGDVHDIGKNILKTLLTAGGFLVTDLGKDVPKDTIVDKVAETNADVLCLSTLMTTTMEGIGNVVGGISEANYRENLTITIGGPPTSEEYAKIIGADHRDNNAQDAVEWLKSRNFDRRDNDRDLNDRANFRAVA